MLQPSRQSPVLFILGATTSGKTEVSLNLAHHLDIEIVNADSRLVYKGMDIGTAKPTKTEQSLVKHHLLDLIQPDDPFSLGIYIEKARTVIGDILLRNKVPVVVGGTGQYSWALIEGWNIPKVTPDPDLRRSFQLKLENMGLPSLAQDLLHIDTDAANKVDLNNPRRVIRALEVAIKRGEKAGSVPSRTKPSFDPRLYGIWYPRSTLRERIKDRIDAMIRNGWVEEVQNMLDAGYSIGLPSFSSAGYREIASYLQGFLSCTEAIEKIVISVNRLARMQNNWFKLNDHRITWSASQSDLIRKCTSALL